MKKMISRLVIIFFMAMLSLALCHNTEKEDKTSLQIWAMKKFLRSIEMDNEIPLMVTKGLKYTRSFNGKTIVASKSSYMSIASFVTTGNCYVV